MTIGPAATGHLRRHALLVGALVALAGCTTAADARRAEGTGKRHSYQASFDEVWGAMPEVVREAGLELVSKDRESRQVIATHGMSLFSYGENVAIFVRPEAADATQVEIVSKAVMSTNVFANDWTDDLFAELGNRFHERG